MKILVLGAGMLAYYLKPYQPYFASKSWKNWENFHILDIRKPESLNKVADKIKPDVIINTAALGNIKRCEKEPELAENTNHLAHRNVIKLCNKSDIKLIFISTSSVFGGERGNYREDDSPHPTTVYGQTKLKGEEATKMESDNWAIFRITAIFGNYPEKQDFIQKTISEFKAGKSFEFWDQVISPSYGPFVAETIIKLVERDVNGIWHIAGAEQLSRYEIGEIILRCVGKGNIKRVNTPKGLPGNRSLCVEKLKKELNLKFPDFQAIITRLI